MCITHSSLQYIGCSSKNARALQAHRHVLAQWCPTLCDPVDCTLQAPLSMGFSRQEYWGGLPFPSPGDLPSSGIELGLLHLLHCRWILDSPRAMGKQALGWGICISNKLLTDFTKPDSCVEAHGCHIQTGAPSLHSCHLSTCPSSPTPAPARIGLLPFAFSASIPGALENTPIQVTTQTHYL